MLVLSRKTGERIQIGDDVVVTIVRIGPNNVRIGIDAPRNLSVIREELVECDQQIQPATEDPRRTTGFTA